MGMITGASAVVMGMRLVRRIRGMFEGDESFGGCSGGIVLEDEGRKRQGK